jgi:hypothetical protein
MPGVLTQQPKQPTQCRTAGVAANKEYFAESFGSNRSASSCRKSCRINVLLIFFKPPNSAFTTSIEQNGPLCKFFRDERMRLDSRREKI